jgi:hypothetical protein
MTQNIGEGHFLGDGDTDEDSDEDIVMGRGRVDDSSDGAYDDATGDAGALRARRQKAGEDDRDRGGSLEDDGKEFDQDTFMEQMLLDMHQQQEDEESKAKALEDQIKAQEDEEKRVEDQKRATYNDNQFWTGGVGDQYDIDDLMKELDT